MLKKLLIHIGFIAPPVFDSVDAIEAGVCVLSGRLHATATLESPIGQQPCVAFWYQSWFTGIRGSGGAVKRLRNVVAYAPGLSLALGDGLVELQAPLNPEGASEMTPEQHRRLDESDIPGFKARERIILEGDEVKVRGDAKWTQAESLWRLTDFDLLLD